MISVGLAAPRIKNPPKKVKADIVRNPGMYVPWVSKRIPKARGVVIPARLVTRLPIPRIVPKLFLPKYSPRIAANNGPLPPCPIPKRRENRKDVGMFLA